MINIESFFESSFELDPCLQCYSERKPPISWKRLIVELSIIGQIVVYVVVFNKLFHRTILTDLVDFI